MSLDLWYIENQYCVTNSDNHWCYPAFKNRGFRADHLLLLNSQTEGDDIQIPSCASRSFQTRQLHYQESQ
jgi:hypothetical protein